MFATSRTPEKATELQALAKNNTGARIHIIQLTATDEESVKKAAKEVEAKLQGKGLDILVNNIGIAQADYHSNTMSSKDLRDNFETNVVAVQVVTDAFIELIKKSKEKKIINISSAAGSITIIPKWSLVDNSNAFKFGYTPYPVSKAALNMLTAFYAAQYGKEGFVVIPIHPGLVRTDMNTNTDAELMKTAISVEESANTVVGVINKLTPEDNGKFFDNNGNNLPW